MLEELFFVIFIFILSFIIGFLLNESLFNILLFSSSLLGFCSAFSVISEMWETVSIVIFAYCVYDLIWGHRL